MNIVEYSKNQEIWSEEEKFADCESYYKMVSLGNNNNLLLLFLFSF